MRREISHVRAFLKGIDAFLSISQADARGEQQTKQISLIRSTQNVGKICITRIRFCNTCSATEAGTISPPHSVEAL